MQALEKQHLAKYLTDFPEEEFLENDRILMLPHLGIDSGSFGRQRTFGS